MIVLIALLFVVLVSGEIEAVRPVPKQPLPEEIISEGMKYGDRNHDNKLSRAEVTWVRTRALGRFSELKEVGLWAANIAGFLEEPVTVDQIFIDCDANEDDFITFDDYIQLRYISCLDTPSKVRDAMKYVILPGREGLFDKP